MCLLFVIAEKLCKKVKVVEWCETSTKTPKEVIDALSNIVKEVWDAQESKKKPKAGAGVINAKNPKTERQILELGKQLSDGEITYEQWDTRVKDLLEAQKVEREQRRKAKRLFDKIDEDASGTIDAEEFAKLAKEMGGGEAWTEEELVEALKEIDKGA